MENTVLSSLNSALHRALAMDERVYVLGEDIIDPYGGAFKVTRGLSQAFPKRVFSTPISEAGIVGLAAGMALRGLHPVVEIMFGDFLSLAADQIINHLSKFRWMYNEQVQLPLVIRTPMGGRRGYGPTHSQTLEKIFLGIPGLRVIASTTFNDPGTLLLDAILNTQEPVLFIENKLLYPLPLKTTEDLLDFDLVTVGSNTQKPLTDNSKMMVHCTSFNLSIRGAPSPSLTLLAYGYMAELAQKAIYRLAYEYEVFAELIILTQLAPFDISAILASVQNTSRLLVMEEGTLSLGWGAEIVARIAEASSSNHILFKRLAAKDFPVPASLQLEETYFPGEDDIIQAGLQLTGRI
ncbi:MAG: alpha-ketoacid dehydrogenase subunit beta [Chloroflexi bacterium]|nr:alpha-ketoacid dehydrogenase subunit beta [Chloroflexota bacterium]